MANTIFISSFNPFILRNILIGDALKILKENKNTRIVVFVPDYKADFFGKEIGEHNVIIEGIKNIPTSRQSIIFNFLGSSLVNSPTILVHKRVQLNKDGRVVRFLASFLLIKIFSRSGIFKKLVRKIDYITIGKNYFDDFFLKYKPDLIFATDVFNNNDVYLLATAKSRGIKTVGMIRSWDNITNKGFFRVEPGNLLVQNNVLKNQAIKHCSIKENKIKVTGVPQYDNFINGNRIGRESFFKKIGLDPNKKLILFSPFGNRFTDTDWNIMEILKRFIKNGLIPASQVIVRCTPNDEVFFGKFIPDENFYIDKPGHGFFKNVFKDQELTFKDMNWLADCLYYSDVIIAGGASIGIDAAIFGKPTILIHFDGFENKPYWNSVKRFLKYKHPDEIIRSGAMRSAADIDEFKKYIVEYLANPYLDNEARKTMLVEQYWKLDGLSGKRVGFFLLECLENKNL